MLKCWDCVKEEEEEEGDVGLGCCTGMDSIQVRGDGGVFR